MKKTLGLLFSLFLTVFLFAEQPIVKDIRAVSGKGSKINVLWTLPTNPDSEITSFQIYRDTKQITSYNQIKKLTPVAEVKAEFTGYTDTVSDFKDYFYAVIAVTDKPYDLVLLSFNSTVTGAHLNAKTTTKENVKVEEEKLYPDGTLREKPLPFVDIAGSLPNSDNNQKKTEISEQATEATNSLITKTSKKSALLKPFIFEDDLVSPDGGDDYLLFEILKTTFIQRKYGEAIEQLNKLVGTNISESTRNRAYFYMGESQYLLGNYDEAVKTFVKVGNDFPIQSKKWLDSSLERL